MFNCSSSRVRWHVIWIRKKSRIAKELARQGRWINQPIWQICASQIGSFLFLGIGVKIKKNETPSELGISNQFFQTHYWSKGQNYITLPPFLRPACFFSVKKLFLFLEKYGQHKWRIFTPKGWYRGHPTPNIGLFNHSHGVEIHLQIGKIHLQMVKFPIAIS